MTAAPKKKCAQCGLNRQAKFFTSAKGRVCVTCQRKTRRASSHSNRIANTYGITGAEYAALLKLQGGVCAICGGTRGYRLDVDHDHALEKTVGTRLSVRGLLCRNCNRHLLPACFGNPEILLAAARYLKSPPARRVIRRRVVVRR